MLEINFYRHIFTTRICARLRVISLKATEMAVIKKAHEKHSWGQWLVFKGNAVFFGAL